MKTKFIALLSAGFMFASDSGFGFGTEAADGASFSKNFIQVYLLPNELVIYSYGDEYIKFAFRGESIDNRNKDKQDEFNVFAERYNDLTYNSKLVPYSHNALGAEYSAIEVTCEPAAEYELMLCVNSFKKFIENGYKDASPLPDYIDDHSCFKRQHGLYPILKPVAEIVREDLVLSESEMYLYFATPPPAGEYEFTINVRPYDSEALTLTARAVVAFE